MYFFNKRISVSICDLDGKFVLYDKLSEGIYDMSKKSIEKKSIFNQMIPFSIIHLK